MIQSLGFSATPLLGVLWMFLVVLPLAVISNMRPPPAERKCERAGWMCLISSTGFLLMVPMARFIGDQPAYPVLVKPLALLIVWALFLASLLCGAFLHLQGKPKPGSLFAGLYCFASLTFMLVLQFG